MRRRTVYKITGFPAVIIVLVPMLIGWAWIITALIRAAV